MNQIKFNIIFRLKKGLKTELLLDGNTSSGQELPA